ncbi:MAG: sulfatase-like hydrolase/transferase [Candidatus Krumholzibacteria bacterium]|nr:sulfatase-like hydrolase/transferase [Candidatus Krumholzibacteria bacterium]
MKERHGAARSLQVQFVLAVFCVYLYILMEWLFFVTKPSFLSGSGRFDQVIVLFATPLLLAASAAGLLLVVRLPALACRRDLPRAASSAAGLAIPAVILALALFLLVDNFTYTIFRFGVKTFIGWKSLVYGALVLVLAAFSYTYLQDIERKLLKSGRSGILLFVAIGLLLVSVVFALVGYSRSGSFDMALSGAVESAAKRPNILIIAGDGLNADHMSAYGYRRDTTPFIRELAERGLLCENCFTNASSSGGSIASMMTGRLPTQTRCVYPPDILRGADSYRHLPGILKTLGYRNYDKSVRHFGDPYDLNMRRSFDRANDKEYTMLDESWSDRLISLFGQQVEYFMEKLYERIGERLLHAFRVRAIDDAYSRVAAADEEGIGRPGPPGGRPPGRGERKAAPKVMKTVYSFVRESSAPFFVHLHLLGTHGPKFRITPNNVFSAGQREHANWMDDFYDDAILAFDNEVRNIVGRLEKTENPDNTLIVICTDHGQKWSVDKRLPLIFVFPEGPRGKRIAANVQNLDIAPTILDYLGIEKPAWMEGASLLSGKIDPMRPIFTVQHNVKGQGRIKGQLRLEHAQPKPPFYSMGTLGVLLCDRLYRLRLDESLLIVSQIRGHTLPCADREMLDQASAERLLIEHLEENGYDTRSIRQPLSVCYPDSGLAPAPR